MMEAHLSSVEIVSGIPVSNLEFGDIGGTLFAYNGGTGKLHADINTLKMLILELTKALHAAEMIRDHCANCEKCTMEALGASKS